MNLNKVSFVFFLFILNTNIFSQTILRHNELMFSNNGGFRDVMHEESIYPLIPDDVNYLDSIIWLTATASLTAEQGYGTMNLVVRPPEIGSDRVFKKHLWAGPWKGGSGDSKEVSRLYARINHYKGSASFDNTINTNLENSKTNFVNDFSSLLPINKALANKSARDKYTPFISEFRIGTSLYENLMYINVEEGTLSGGKTGLSIETYEAIDITLERVNPVKLGLQMEGGDIFAGNLFVDDSQKKVFFSNGKNLSPSEMVSKMRDIYENASTNTYDNDESTALIVSGNVVAEQLFGQVVRLDSFTLKPDIGKICYNSGNTYTIHSSQLLEKKCIDKLSEEQFGIPGNLKDIFSNISDDTARENHSSVTTMASQQAVFTHSYPEASFKHSDNANENLISGYFPLNWLFKYNTFRINLLSPSFFKSTSTLNLNAYKLPHNADRILVNVQATVGAFDSLGEGFNHTICTKIRWHKDADPLQKPTDYTATPDSNKLTDSLGASSAMCKDYSTHDSEFTFFHTFAISITNLPQAHDLQFDLNIYTVYEDGYNEHKIEDYPIFPEYIEVSNTSLIIQSFPADPTNDFTNVRPTNNFDLKIKTYKDFGRHDHLE